MILPFLDKDKPIPDAYRLIFVNAFTLYYSYQHPIAFLSRGVFVVRDDYWNRRRGERATHKAYILTDIEKETGSKPVARYSLCFLEDVQAEFEHFGLSTPGKIGPAVKTANNTKRRVVL